MKSDLHTKLDQVIGFLLEEDTLAAFQRLSTCRLDGGPVYLFAVPASIDAGQYTPLRGLKTRQARSVNNLRLSGRGGPVRGDASREVLWNSTSFPSGNGLFVQSRRQSARLLVRRPAGRRTSKRWISLILAKNPHFRIGN